LTGIIMLAEMTQDHRVTLPLIITTSMAYAVRKTLMEESIYSLANSAPYIVNGLIV
jgi:H+/Cl- antiporter ClcA